MDLLKSKKTYGYKEINIRRILHPNIKYRRYDCNETSKINSIVKVNMGTSSIKTDVL